MSSNEMRLLIINPRTGNPISKDTLQKAFADELASGKAGSKLLVRRNAYGDHRVWTGVASPP